MSLDHILLGVLREPATGYDVKRWFDLAFAHFWPAELSQVYRTLQRLEDDGLLVSRSEPSPRGPARRVYSTTPEGTATLKAWIAEGPVHGVTRLPWLAQTIFLASVPRRRQLAFLRTLRGDFLATIEELDQAARMQPEPDDRVDEGFFRTATIDLGLRIAHARVEWVDAVIARIDA